MIKHFDCGNEDLYPNFPKEFLEYNRELQNMGPAGVKSKLAIFAGGDDVDRASASRKLIAAAVSGFFVTCNVPSLVVLHSVMLILIPRAQ